MIDAVPDKPGLRRLRVAITGVVQGVGFRPFVYNTAIDSGLTGFVGNDSKGVFVEVEGNGESLDQFADEVKKNSPPLAYIDRVRVEEIPAIGSKSFEIRFSEDDPSDSTLVSPDVAVCDDCLAELFDTNDRRYGYPFINCTNCGPRFTITRSIPYDRPNTTMSVFEMCEVCRAEYEDPSDRRFHAQPNACADCGPTVQFIDGSAKTDGRRAIEAAGAALENGQVLAVKGIGGFHLACDARNDESVRALRERKGRVEKPFAIMCRDLDAAARFAVVSDTESTLLESLARPIVLLKKRKNNGLAPSIAPGNDHIGVMLPYSPLHHLLLADKDALVMTSGNYSDEPIVKDNEEAFEKLGSLCDVFLIHDRDIHVHCDDSVVRIAPNHDGALLPVRRSRGYAPFPVGLPFDVPPVMATGGELKATFCLARDDFAFMSQHIGDMENLETLQSFENAFEHMKRLFRIEPSMLACDRHPNYLSSRWAEKIARGSGIELVKVQHHHAHIAAVMAENGVRDNDVIGFAFDGTGYGDDGTIWGGEVLYSNYAHYERYAFLRPFRLPGGDAAVKNPFRVALGLLDSADIEWDDALGCVAAADEVELNVLRTQFDRDFAVAWTSSFGRLFDAAASIANLRHRVNYEAQAAIEFESSIDRTHDESYRFEFAGSSGPIGWESLIADLVADSINGTDAGVISARFHNAVAALILEVSEALRDESGCRTVALSGGCFQNVSLLKRATELLTYDGFEVLTHCKVPPNDGGIALGQAVVASAKSKSSRSPQ